VKLAIAILVLGGAALVSLLLPYADGAPSWLRYAWDTRPLNAILLVAGVAFPIAIGAWSALRPPLVRWQAIAATAGFGMLFLKIQLWRGLPRIVDAAISIQLMTAAVFVGLAVSLAAIIASPDI
jgi:hypothetical protein